MRSFGTAGLIVLLSGCAAIFGSKQKNFDLRSNPTRSEVFLDGARVGTTPFKVNLSNQKEHTFVFRKEGYKEVSCTLTKGTGGGWVVADILLGLVPVIIDAATNSWSQTRGDSCMGSLEPLAASDVAPTGAPAPVATDQMPPAVAPQEQGQYHHPVVGYDKLPPGINFVGDGRTKRYYSIGCGAAQQIPPESQYLFGTEAAAIADGFRASADC